ncbi:MAG: ANTAR domain-containing protein [Gemmatirosa sp.]|nr:ANTAR domain-containing protein [Gemmatirosa sp.]
MTESVAAMRVMIADDDAEARTMLVEVLARLGHQVVAEVGTGRDAVTHALAEAPDVVLLDVHMPEGSGIDAAREITAALPGTAVVLFTGDHGLTLSDADIAETSAITLLAKPAPTNALDAALRSAVAQARALRSAKADADKARKALEDRKTIERAKGILMRRTGSTEQEAYRILQRTSQDKSVPMVAVAKAVIDSEPGAAASRPEGRGTTA